MAKTLEHPTRLNPPGKAKKVKLSDRFNFKHYRPQHIGVFGVEYRNTRGDRVKTKSWWDGRKFASPVPQITTGLHWWGTVK